MKISIQEAKISNISINSHRNLIFRLTVKPTDYSQELIDLLYEAQDSGTPVSVAMVGFQEEREDQRPKKLARLGYLMSAYAEKTNVSEEELCGKTYAKYNVRSRTELTEDQLNAEIDSYSFGLQND